MRFTLRLASSVQKSWREASTLLVASEVYGNGSKNRSLEYLLLERSAESRFMPGGLCFPGGTISLADSSKRWNDLYQSANLGLDLISAKFMDSGANRPVIYNPEYKEPEEILSREVSFRITAIRETFEESGVLFCKPSGDPKLLDNFLSDKNEVNKWQKKISDEPENFVCLCDTLQCVPDLHALVEWSNWLTPPSYETKKRRFDTMFFMALIPSTRSRPNVYPDGGEMASFLWLSAKKLLKGHADGNHFLLPPQTYEMLRLQDVNSADQMCELLKLRNTHGIERWCPFLFGTKDNCTISTFPGDDLYPENPDVHTYQKFVKLDLTSEELTNKNAPKHRTVIPAEGMPYVDISSSASRFGQSYTPKTN